MDLLHRYHWPGNVRELAAMVKRLAVEAGDSSVITETQVSRETGLEQSLISGDIEYPAVLRAGETLREFLPRQGLLVYQIVLSRCGGNHSRAARRLGIGRTTLYNRLKRSQP